MSMGASSGTFSLVGSLESWNTLYVHISESSNVLNPFAGSGRSVGSIPVPPSDHSGCPASSVPSVKEKSGIRSRSCTWWFSLAVRIKTDCSAFVSPANFSDVLHSSYCQNIQIQKLNAAKETSIVSFSIDTNAASVLRLQNAPFAQIKGFVSTSRNQMCENVVREWLRHKDIVNLELTSLSRCDTKGQLHEKIEMFLKESTTTQSRLAGDSDRQGLRLRVIYAWTVQPPPTEEAARARRSEPRSPQASDRRPLPPALPEVPLLPQPEQRKLLRRRRPLPPRRRPLRLCVCHCAQGSRFSRAAPTLR